MPSSSGTLLLDRIDLQDEVPVSSLRELRQEPGEPRRFAGRPVPVSGAMEASDLRRWCVSRTPSDLNGAERSAPAHVAQAIQYRTFDRRLVPIPSRQRV